MKRNITWLAFALGAGVFATLFACGGGSSSTAATAGSRTSLQGDRVSPLTFANPYGHIPAQCHIETSGGTQNACQYCHTNGVYHEGLGNLPQAGAADNIGNLQTDYSFAPFDATAPLATINRWENTLFPERLLMRVQAAGIDPAQWDMQAYIRQDNWSPAYAQRRGKSSDWDSGVDNPWRLFPGLDPADLPAAGDGFVRSSKAGNGVFQEGGSWITGWRAVNFMPYGIFTPLTGSVSGIYLRLPAAFMQKADGSHDLATYAANLELLAKAIQNRLAPADGTRYVGKAAGITLEPGVYPVGTEFAHPLHYVDVAADGSDRGVSPFPGTRSRRVKEIRYMYKWLDYRPAQFRPGDKSEGGSILGNDTQGWVDNGAGWYLAGYIEAADGSLRPQQREELLQCIGCHSAIRKTEFPNFTSGTGNTIDSTWALPRQFAGSLGWREMDYLGYQADPAATADAVPGRVSRGDPVNRKLGRGEFRHFLENVVGASLYGDMPASVDTHLAATIRRAAGYSADWPALDASGAESFLAGQALRQKLLREFTGRRGHLRSDGSVEAALLLPPKAAALAGAARYRQVVVTQSYTLGKDVFPATPVSFRYLRRGADAFTHLDGTPYTTGEIITDRPVQRENSASINYLLGSAKTLIDPAKPYSAGGSYQPDYLPLLAEPLRFE
jgi:hypothetical protein